MPLPAQTFPDRARRPRLPPAERRKDLTIRPNSHMLVEMRRIRVAVIGVGNCCSSLVQGIGYCRKTYRIDTGGSAYFLNVLNRDCFASEQRDSKVWFIRGSCEEKQPGRFLRLHVPE